MDFDFNDEQYMFRETVRDSLANEFPLDLFRESGEPTQLDAQLWPKLAELGMFSLLVPEADGGLGLTTVDLALVAEEFGAALVPVTVTDTIAAGQLIARYGSDAQKQAYLSRIAEGDLRIACAVYEKDGGYDPADFDAALTDGGNGLRLSGGKLLVAGADSAELLLVLAKRDGKLALALVERDREGVAISRSETLDLTGAYYSLSFDDVAVAGDTLLEGGEEAARFLVDLLAAIAALELAGIGAKLVDTTVDYVKGREQFGRPIGAFQAIKHRLADMAVAVNTARSGAYFAAWAMAHADEAERQRAVSMAKANANEMAVQVMREAVQLHGGMGYTWEMGVHFPYRRGRLLTVLYGSTEYHHERVLTATLAQLARA